MIVIVQGSNVRSPAIFKFLPLKGTSIGAMFDAGNWADLTKNLLLSAISSFDELVGIASVSYTHLTLPTNREV